MKKITKPKKEAQQKKIIRFECMVKTCLTEFESDEWKEKPDGRNGTYTVDVCPECGTETTRIIPTRG